MTCVMVTHDQEEAMTMASRIAVMSEGRFLQVGAPGEIYETPANRFVADFIGNVNLMDGTAGRATSPTTWSSSCADCTPLRRPRHHRRPAAWPVTVALRPEKIRIARRSRAGRADGRPTRPSTACSGTRQGDVVLRQLHRLPPRCWPSGRVLKVSQSNTERQRGGR